MTIEQLKEKYEGKFLKHDGFFSSWEPSNSNIILITYVVQDYINIYDTQVYFIDEHLKECIYSDHFNFIARWLGKYKIVA